MVPDVFGSCPLGCMLTPDIMNYFHVRPFVDSSPNAGAYAGRMLFQFVSEQAEQRAPKKESEHEIEVGSIDTSFSVDGIIRCGVGLPGWKRLPWVLQDKRQHRGLEKRIGKSGDKL